MNKNHRVVWSEHRQAFVVAHEAATSRAPGPSSSPVSSVAKAVAALALSAAAHQAFATPACPAVSGVITVSTSQNFGCYLFSGTSIVVNSGVSIEDGLAIQAYDEVAGSIQNAGHLFGTISGSSSSGAAIFLNNSTVASITNTGTIHGDYAGIQVQGNSSISGQITGDITNSGLITGGNYGLELSNTTIGGGITNSGSIHGEDYGGIYVGSSSIAGAIHNTGTITTNGDGSAIYIHSGSTISGGIFNEGSIGGTADDYNEAGIKISNSTVHSGITNTGTIDFADTSEYANGVFLDNSVVTGGITNTGMIRSVAPSTSEAYGLNVSGTNVTGGITNSGTIIGGDNSTDDGVGLGLYSSHVDSIVNSNQIIGVGNSAGYGIDVSYSTITGGITNSGTIAGSTLGIRVADSTIDGSIVNAADGLITGVGAGIVVESNAVIGGIQNAGIIYGGEGSVYLDNSTSAFVVDNTGTLDGYVGLGINTLNLNGQSSRVIGTTDGDSTSTVNVNGTFTSEGRFRVGTFNVASTGVFNQEHGVTVSGGVSNNGVWNVGDSSRTITGDYEQSSSGTLRLSLADASTYGSLHVTGNAAVANSAKVFVNVIGSPTLVNGSTIAGVLTAGDTLTASASTLAVNDNSALYKFAAATVSDPGHALDLIVSADSVGLPTAVKDAGYTAAAGAAGALQTMFNDGIPAGMQTVFDKLNNMTDEEAAVAVSQTLPSITGASSQAGINALHSMNKIIQSRVESVQGLSSGDGGADRYTWVRAFGNWSDQNNRGGVAGFKSETGGLVIGADAPVSDKVRAGGAFTYAKSNIKSKSSTAASKVDVDTFELVGYASYNIDPRTDINYQLDVGTNKASSSREISFMGTRATADFDSVVVHGSVGIGRLMPISPATNWTPSVRVDYTHMRTEGYTEDGAGPLNLDIDSQTYRELLLTGDAKVSHQFEGGVKLLANASLGYDFINKQAKTTSTFTGGGPTFVTDGLDVSPWFYRLGAGLVKESGTGVEYSIRYDMEGRTSGYVNQSVSAKIRWAF